MITGKVLITGGTGLLGQSIVYKLKAQGTDVDLLDTRQTITDLNLVRDYECIIHLSGAPVANRWTSSHIQEMRRSRIDSVLQIRDLLESLPPDARPRCIVSASAVGIYRNHETEWMTVDSHPAHSPLAELVSDWESAVQSFGSIGVRPVSIRLGLILAPDGGFLARLLPAYRLGLGACIGAGKYPVPWIHIDDAAKLFLWAASTSKARGILPGTSTSSLTMYEYHRLLGRILRRKQWLPRIPVLWMKLALGPMAQILDSGQPIDNHALTRLGFKFEYEHLEEATKALISRR